MIDRVVFYMQYACGPTNKSNWALRDFGWQLSNGKLHTDIHQLQKHT